MVLTPMATVLTLVAAVSVLKAVLATSMCIKH